MSIRKISLWSLWLVFVTYAFIFAPPAQPDTFELIKNMSTGNFAGINPLVIALFNIMGILPAIYGCLLFSDGRGQKIPAWLFIAGSFGLGAFALLPYLALREPNPKFTGEKDLFLKIQDSPWLGLFLTFTALGLLFYGLTQGNWADFIRQWQTSQFIHVMSLDFCLLSLLVGTVLGDDMARRGIENPLIFWSVALTPVVGILIYLCLRPGLPTSSAELEFTN